MNELPSGNLTGLSKMGEDVFDLGRYFPQKMVSISPYFSIPIGSMYAIYGNIYHQYTPNVSIYTIHGSYGIAKCSMTRWFSDVFRVPWELSLEIPGKFEVCLNPEEHAGAEEICRWMAWRWRWTKVWISWFLLRLTIQKCWFFEIYNNDIYIYIYLQSKSWLMEY